GGGGGGGGGGRELLTASRTYYVRTDGSDANNGLANSSGGAFLTIQKAIDVAAALDLSIHDVTIQVGNGTYTQPLTLKSTAGAGKVTIVGDAAAPSNVVISTTSASAVTQEFVRGAWKLRGLKIQTITSGHGIVCRGSYLEIDAIDFGAIVSTQLNVARGATLVAVGDYTISGACSAHIIADSNSSVFINGRTITLTGTPAFSLYFCGAQLGAIVQAGGSTFSGGASGVRYSAILNGVIAVSGGGANYFPGNAGGSTVAGGQYA
ncbi:MAG: hypothetical protein KJZ73_13555, partial [Pseudorhodoplanes sp.]|nr:hypothetical protein [Pseudorhodoplanes sp.]